MAIALGSLSVVKTSASKKTQLYTSYFIYNLKPVSYKETGFMLIPATTYQNLVDITH